MIQQHFQRAILKCLLQKILAKAILLHQNYLVISMKTLIFLRVNPCMVLLRLSWAPSEAFWSQWKVAHCAQCTLVKAAFQRKRSPGIQGKKSLEFGRPMFSVLIYHKLSCDCGQLCSFSFACKLKMIVFFYFTRLLLKPTHSGNSNNFTIGRKRSERIRTMNCSLPLTFLLSLLLQKTRKSHDCIDLSV